MSTVKTYFPSIWRIQKYSRYYSYFMEYLKWGDLKSLLASVQYLIFHRPPEKSWVSQSRLGIFFLRANTSDFQYINYAYELKIKQIIDGLSPHVNYFIDVGACIGEYSIWMAKKGVRCFAFEPVNFESLDRNVRINGLEKMITTYGIGIGAAKEKVAFNIASTNTGSSHIDRTQESGDFEIDTLDNLFADVEFKPEETVLVKLDAEGMEEEVIAGAKQLFSRVKNLYIIYESFINDGEDIVAKRLSEIASFEFSRIDRANGLAKKVCQ